MMEGDALDPWIAFF
jgi:hypothetical protein